MRDLKFRAWDTNNHEWVSSWDGTPIAFTFEGDEITVSWKELGCNCNPALGATCGGCVDTWESKSMKDGVVLSQYTGLKDKNGKEIYEGYMVRAQDGDKTTSESWKVIFEDARFSLENERATMGLHYWASCELEVIGNIFENPELLS